MAFNAPASGLAAEAAISRDEAISLLFNVADIAQLARRLYELLPEDGDEDEEADEG